MTTWSGDQGNTMGRAGLLQVTDEQAQIGTSGVSHLAAGWCYPQARIGPRVPAVSRAPDA